VRCRIVDLVLAKGDGEPDPSMIERLLWELRGTGDEVSVAHRGAHRWVQRFARLRRPPAPADVLRQGGVYLITGGLGAMGLTLAEHLARACGARLALVGRSAVPPRTQWKEHLASHDDDDARSGVIRALQRIEAAGGEILVLSADVADRVAMADAIARTCKRFGALNGVIHAAGTTDAASFGPLEETDRALCERHFGPKIKGVRVLRELLRDQTLDFCVLCSSLSALLGGLGFIAYAAANAYMDAFAWQQCGDRRSAWLSIDWDGWRFRAGAPAATTLDQLAITPSEGVEAFDRAISAGHASQIVVSTGDLDARMDHWVRFAAAGAAEAPVDIPPAPATARPTLRDSYVPPSNDIEQAIAELWQRLIGVDRVGINDNFFELGGHSLLAVQLISRLRDRFQIELSVHRLFEGPTVAELASSVAAALSSEHAALEKLDRMLSLVEGMSDEEVRELLAHSEGAPDEP